MIRNIVVLTLMAAVLVTTAPIANAQEDTDEWQFNIVPLYLWAVDIGGSMDIRGHIQEDFSVDFSDAFSNLEMAFTVHFEARKGRWGILADLNYLDLEGTQELVIPGQSADVSFKNQILEGAVGYEFADDWWAIAGVRYFKLDSEVTFQIRPPLQPSASWTDLFAGLMWRHQLGKRWDFSARLDAGAGGSELVVNAAALADYRLGSWAAVLIGYRYLDYEYEDRADGINVNMSMSGPVAALRFFW